MTYFIHHAAGDTSVLGDAWNNVPRAEVTQMPWAEFRYNPNTIVQLLADDDSLLIRFQTEESPLRAMEHEEDGTVCVDSCMEFFFSPAEGDNRYLNFEINPLGTLHLGLGDGRHNRTHPERDRNLFEIQSLISNGKWSLRYRIPFSFLRSIFGKLSDTWRGNFYKCGDKTGHEHYCVWNPVVAPQPDYHRPECFGILKFVPEQEN